MKSNFIKKILLLSLCLIINVSLLVGCDNSNKKEINIFNWTEYIPQNVLDDFEKEYGIKVNYSNYSSNDELLAKLKSSSEGTYDVIVPSDYMMEIMSKSGLIQELDKSKFTNFKNLDEAALNQDFDKDNSYSVPFLAGGVAIAINTDIVKEDIKSYKDLLNSKYKESIVLLDEQRAVIGMALKATNHSMNDYSDESLNDAKEYLMKLKPNIKAFDSDSPKTALITGEAGIGVIWNAEISLAMSEKDNIKVVYPQEGIYLNMDNFAIPKGAKNIDSAYLFIDYMLRPEVITKVSEAYPYRVINKAAYDILSDSYKNNKASNIPKEEIVKGEYIKDIGENTSKFDKLWSEFKGE